MTPQLRKAGLLAICIAALNPSAAQSAVIATSKGAGADAEVRDHQQSTNFGASTELATRILDTFPLAHASDVSDRFSAMYLKFDISGQAVLTNQTTAVRLTYRNSNLTTNRLHDTTPPGNNTDFRTGLAFYGLDRDSAGNNWSESTITYATAPGIASDGNFGTKDFDFVDPDGAGNLRVPLTPLGVALFPVVPPQNHLPVGGELLFSSDALNAFVTASQQAAKTTVTIVAAIVHDGKVPVNDWKNFNYVFNPKEMITLSDDLAYDADTTSSANPLGSPWSGDSNAADANGFSPFSPQLILATSGDFNVDGLVNAADYTVWRNSLGQSGSGLAADGNRNDRIDDGDYDIWRLNFNQAGGSGTSTDGVASIPEPATLLPFLTTLLIAATARRCSFVPGVRFVRWHS